jgi:hypothetical protein
MSIFGKHIRLIKEVLRRLQEHKLAVELEKSCFHVQEVEFLGLVLNGKDIRMEEAKVKEITEWLQSRRFIRHFHALLALSMISPERLYHLSGHLVNMVSAHVD